MDEQQQRKKCACLWCWQPAAATLHYPPPFIQQKIAHFATNHTAGEGEVLSNLTQPTHDEIMMHMPF